MTVRAILMTTNVINNKFLDDRKLFTIPESYSEILQITKDANSDLEELSKVIIRDPAISVKVLNLANSSFYGGIDVTDISRAIIRIGFNATASLALSAMVYNFTKNCDTNIDKVKFWRHSLEVAIASRLIAKYVKDVDPNEVYTCGLLHDLGILFFELLISDNYEITCRQTESEFDLCLVEESLWDMSHSDIGRDVLSHWGIPKKICDVVGHHHYPFDNKDYLKESCIVALANLISNSRIIGHRGDALEKIVLKERLIKILEIDEELLSEIQNELPFILNDESAFLDEDIGSLQKLLLSGYHSLTERWHITNDKLNSLIKNGYKILESLPENEKILAVEQLKSLKKRFNDLITELTDEINPVNENSSEQELTNVNQVFGRSLLFAEELLKEGSQFDPESQEVDDESDKCVVWYGTNRKPINNDPCQGFSAKRDSITHYGKCVCSIPGMHKTGSVGSNFIMRLKDGDDRIKVEEIIDYSADLYWESITNELAQFEFSKRTALVFIPGYKTSFEKAAIRSAQLHYDLKIDGITAFYSWASKDKIYKYFVDEATIKASAKHIENFLLKFALMKDIDQVNVVAHSMGSRALTEAINNIIEGAKVKSKKFIKNIILAAADIDQEAFQNISEALSQAGERITIYTSKKDIAIKLSKIIHGFERLGGKVTFVKGRCDMIDASNTGRGFLRHGYLYRREVLSDINQLIHYNTPPRHRFGIKEIMTKDKTIYWKLQESS